jgi:hypothetical protein
MVFKPGRSGNPAGRRPMRQILRNLAPKKANEIRGLDLVASVADHTSAPLQMRLQAGTILAQYQELRPAERIGRDLGLPVATSVEIATQNIAKIGAEAAADRLSADIAAKLISHQQSYIEARVACDIEAAVANFEAAIERLPPPVDVKVEGGLPDLPGSSILMPPRVITPPPRRHHDRDNDNGGGEP